MITRILITRPDAYTVIIYATLSSRSRRIHIMERPQKSSKEKTSKNSGSKRSLKSREPLEQVHIHATFNALIHIHFRDSFHAASEI